MLIHTLVVAAPSDNLRRIIRAISSANTLTTGMEDPDELWNRLGSGTFDLVVLSRSTVPELSRSPTLIEEIRRLPDRPDVIVLSDGETPEERAAMLGAGCLAVLAEDLSDPALQGTLDAIVRRRRDDTVHRLPSVGDARLSSIITRSPVMERFLELGRRVVGSNSTLLVLGETGVGKEWLARAVHAEGPRGDGPFVAVNCAALSEALLESELFGHEKGSFTGATRSRRGYFEVAHGGTIFLDEIGELPLHLQVKLLRVLQERRIQPVGSERMIEVDVRVMAATNRDLEAEVRQKRFRADLFYRLNVVSLTVPPLRERREDIPPLVARYIGEFRAHLRQDEVKIDDAALRALVDYDWPGNIRELINVIERAVLMSTGGTIRTTDLPEGIRGIPANPMVFASSTPLPIEVEGEMRGWLELPWSEARRRIVESAERYYFEHLLEEASGRVGEAAELAGIHPRSLFEKMRHHGLQKETFKRRKRRPRDD